MKYLLFFSLIYVSFFGQSQDIHGIEEWEFHFPYNRPTLLANATNRIYVASRNSIFFFDKQDNNLQKLTKKDGLSEIEISAIEYNPTYKTLLIAYVNGMIDLIINEKTYINIDDITRANIVGSKKINHILFDDKIAYLSTDFGLIQLDIVKYEIKDSYRNIGENGKQLRVFESTINSNSKEIFIVSEEGLKKGTLQKNINLLDYNNWTIEKDTSFQIKHLATNNNITYFFSKKDTSISYLKNNEWIKIQKISNILKNKRINSFRYNSASKSILMAFEHNLLEIKDTNNVQEVSGNTWGPQNAIIDNEGFLWVASYSEGVRSNYFGEWKSLYPTGPSTSDATHFYHYEEKEYVLRGGYQYDYVGPNWKSPEYSIYENQNWTNKASDKGLGFSDMVINPANNYTYFASFGEGVIYLKPDGTYHQWKTDSEGIPLKGINRIPSVELDNENNVWLTSFLASGQASLYKIDKNNQWTAYSVNYENADFFVDITIDNFGVKWLRVKGASGRNGIYAFDERLNKGRYLTNNPSNGNLPDATINDVKKDNENRIWVATNNGVAVFDNQGEKTGNITSSNVLNSDTRCRLPIVAEQGLPMLLGEVVNCIAIDGANRKWIGTNSGLWLFNDNGTIILKKFDTENSPLPTNEITSLDINGKTGELFIGTSFGVVSYWDGTTTAEPTHEKELKIFPNPVKIGQNQSITIQGLAENATVKITDITGRIITEKRALGGTVIWNGHNVNGQAAKSGIYLVYSVSADGEEGFVGKFALIE